METYSLSHEAEIRRESLRYRDCWHGQDGVFNFMLALVENTAHQTSESAEEEKSSEIREM